MMTPQFADSQGTQLKVFVSSVIGGYAEYRDAAKEAIELAGHMPVLMESTHHASPNPPRGECLATIESSDVVVLLVGERYGDPQESGKSATHEEWEHARDSGKRILVFFEDVKEREPQQEAFWDEVGQWENGSFAVAYSRVATLISAVCKALRGLNDESVPASGTDPLEGLPPTCRTGIEAIKPMSAATAEQLVGLLCDPTLRQPGALALMMNAPPDWLANAGAVAWEVLSSFLDAHDLPGSDLAREKAIEAGTPRAGLHLARMALARADEGEHQEAVVLLKRMSPGDPLLAPARALLADDFHAAMDAVRTARLVESEDAEPALFGLTTLAWAYRGLDRLDLATATLREANQRFPGRAGLLLLEAGLTVDWARADGVTEADRLDRLVMAVELAIRSRDLFRRWSGPSHKAVSVATTALIYLEDPQRVLDLALPAPAGEATVAEAEHTGLRQNVARALLLLRRYEQFDTLRLDDLRPSEAALIRAMLARASGDEAALTRARAALALADDEASRLHALVGLASLGEVDDAALCELATSRPADVALIRAIAALENDDSAAAVDHLLPYRLESPLHADVLATALAKAGATDDALATFIGGAEHLGAPSLYVGAAELLSKERRFSEAISLASRALASSVPRPSARRLRSALVNIARERQDWQEMEFYARALAQQFPEEIAAHWDAVYALHRQGRNQDGWTYLNTHEMDPYDAYTAQVVVAVCGGADIPEQDAGRILKLAELYADDEAVAGPAITTLMLRSDRFRFTEAQRSRVYELAREFVERFPDSSTLQAVDFPTAEDLLSALGEDARARAFGLAPLVEQVRCGALPYGVLQHVSGLPYTSLLLSLEAGYLTAISSDEGQRAREQSTALVAVGQDVAVDTSVVALGLHAGLPVNELGNAFESVLVADELVGDARVAVADAKLPRQGVVHHDPVLDRPVPIQIDERQRELAQQRAEAALAILNSWQIVRSAPLRPPPPVEVGEWWPYFASIWVAAARSGRALWCDDIALRAIAEAHGVPAFSTWALYEALASTGPLNDLRPGSEIKMGLLRARIADVPLSLSELTEGLDEGDGPDTAVAHFLQRPCVWLQYRSEALQWYMDRVKALCEGLNRHHLPELLYAAALGLGSAVVASDRQGAIGGMLAATLMSASEPAMTPVLLAASRYAARATDLSLELDPLDGAVNHLLRTLESNLDAGSAAQRVVWLFSEAERSDRLSVTAIVLRER